MSQNSVVDILIPSWNNPQFLQPALQSLLHTKTAENLFHIYVINNGHKESCDWINHPDVTVLQAGENLGWEGGLKLGLSHSKAPYVMFLNDDTYIPDSSRMWINQMLQHFKNPKVAAVGPSTNVVMGLQNIFATTAYQVFRAKFLIGYCMLVRRSYLDEVGGVDDSLPGGDDLDLSIRFRDAGYYLFVDREVFVYHHGFKTGTRLHGDHTTSGGWNSYEFKEKTDTALIRKHGFRKWADVMSGVYQMDFTPEKTQAWEDAEGDLIRERIKKGVTLDLGCGGNKTIPDAIGVDMIKKDDVVETLMAGTKSSADVNADVSEPLPFEKEYADTIIARHILEHLHNPYKVIRQWVDVLKKGGKLIIAVPDDRKIGSITMNIEHKHAFTPDFLADVIKECGLKVVEQLDSQNGVSFITVAEKL